MYSLLLVFLNLYIRGGFNANCSSALVRTGIGATKKNKDLMNSNNLSEIPDFIIPAFSF